MATANEIAAHLDVSPRRVLQLVTEKVIPSPKSRGVYDLKESVISYIRFLRKESQGGITLTDARTVLAKEQAERIAHENRLLRGEVVEIDDAAEVLGVAIEVIRSKLLGMGDRLAVHVVACNDIREAKAAIDRYAEEVLTELSEVDVRRAIRIPSGDSGEDAEVPSSPASEGERVGGPIP